MENPEAQLRTLHRVYCETTGQQPPYICCQRILWDFSKQGFGEDDIRDVATHVKRANLKFSGGGFSLRFEKLFETDQDGIFVHFGSLLGEARGAKRAADHKAKHSYPPAKASVLRATGRPDAPAAPDGCIPIHQALKQIRESL